MSSIEKTGAGLSLEQLFPIIEEKLSCGGEVTFKPHGISMLPLLRQGKDSITVGKLDKKPSRLDVIFYRRKNGQFVLHRIIGKDNNGYILCGDNQFAKEHGVTDDMIIGIMTAFYRGGTRVETDSSRYLMYCRVLWARRIYLHMKSLVRRVLGKLKRMIKK